MTETIWGLDILGLEGHPITMNSFIWIFILMESKYYCVHSAYFFTPEFSPHDSQLWNRVPSTFVYLCEKIHPWHFIPDTCFSMCHTLQEHWQSWNSTSPIPMLPSAPPVQTCQCISSYLLHRLDFGVHCSTFPWLSLSILNFRSLLSSWHGPDNENKDFDWT